MRSFPDFLHDKTILFCDFSSFCLLTQDGIWVKINPFFHLEIVFFPSDTVMYSIAESVDFVETKNVIIFIHDSDSPKTGSKKLCPVDGRAACPDTIVIIRVKLCFCKGLSASTGTAVHIGISDWSAVQDFSDCFSKDRHIVGSPVTPVFQTFSVPSPLIAASLIARIRGGTGKTVYQCIAHGPASLCIIWCIDLSPSACACTTSCSSGKPVIPGKRGPDNDRLGMPACADINGDLTIRGQIANPVITAYKFYPCSFFGNIHAGLVDGGRGYLKLHIRETVFQGRLQIRSFTVC